MVGPAQTRSGGNLFKQEAVTSSQPEQSQMKCLYLSGKQAFTEIRKTFPHLAGCMMFNLFYLCVQPCRIPLRSTVTHNTSVCLLLIYSIMNQVSANQNYAHGSTSATCLLTPLPKPVNLCRPLIKGYELNGMRIAVRYPDRIPPGMGISKTALKADNLPDENPRLVLSYHKQTSKE